MKARLPMIGFFLAILGILGVASLHPALSQERDDTIILVAKRQLADQIYGSTILIVKPLGGDRHVGFILNKPTQMTLGKLFPNHPPSQKVTSPVYLGGPFNSQVIFAMVRRHDSPGGRSVRIAPDLYLAIDSQVVDKIIESDSEHARFFAGMVLWRPGELADELKRGLWYTLDARADLVLRKTDGLWEELVGRSERQANTI
jgi:putative transcriptional regulator